MNGDVLTLGVWNGQLVVGGKFTVAGTTAASCIATFDGTAWQALGSGLALSSGSGVQAQAVASYGGQLVVGGTFTSAGGVLANYIAAWDGTSWAPLGGGVDGPSLQVASLLVHSSGKLIAGGTFLSAGGTICNSIAAWDGATWQPFDTGLQMTNLYGACKAFTEYHGALYATGNMSTAGNVSSWYIARYDAALVTAAPSPREGDSGLRIWTLTPTGNRGPVELAYSLRDSGAATIRVLDARGRVLWASERRSEAGTHRIVWNGLDATGHRVASGHYIAVVESESGVARAGVLFLR